MGVNLKDIIHADEIKIKDLSGKKIGIDAYNWTYQFLSTIRLRTGELLKDSKGRVTSHLIGIFNRTINLLKDGIKPVYVWDGKPPEFKNKTLQAREKIKVRAEKAFKLAKTDEERRKYAQQTSRLTQDMIKDANEVLDVLGVPFILAPSEGEAQISYMVKKGDLWACASQDWDSLLFGSRFLIRNLSISGKKKIPRTMIYKTINPELIDLDKNLKRLGINRKQLIMIAMLIGTDYCPGVKGYGPKKSLEIVRKEKTLEKVMRQINWDFEVEPREVLSWFLNPKTTDKYKLEWKKPDYNAVLKLLVDEYEFNQDRVENQLKQILDNKKHQVGLGKYLK